MDALVALTPGSPEAEPIQHAIESRLMDALRNGRRPAGEGLGESLAAHGYTVQRLGALPRTLRGGGPLPAGGFAPSPRRTRLMR